MSKKKEIHPEGKDEMRLDPENHLCSKFDSASVAKFPVAPRDKMGYRVVDDCAEEHIM